MELLLAFCTKSRQFNWKDLFNWLFQMLWCFVFSGSPSVNAHSGRCRVQQTGFKCQPWAWPLAVWGLHTDGRSYCSTACFCASVCFRSLDRLAEPTLKAQPFLQNRWQLVVIIFALMVINYQYFFPKTPKIPTVYFCSKIAEINYLHVGLIKDDNHILFRN